MRRAWLTVAVFALALPAPGCRLDDSGTALELTVRVQSQGDVGALSFHLWTMDGSAPRMIGNRSVDRTVAELAADPVELRFSPLSRASYVLHLVGTSPTGETFVATRCYDLTGSLIDAVLLAGPLGPLDGDGDSFVSDPSGLCFEPGPRACGPEDHRCDTAATADCDDSDGNIYPGAPTICQNGIDEDCDGLDEECGDNDGDGIPGCSTTPMPGCDCNDADATINPRAEDICQDGIDQDCDGVDACCDMDGDGYPQCREGGEIRGDCVDIASDCEGVSGCDPASINPGAAELCDAIDNNCNGLIDEVDDCRGPDLDRDGVWTCGREPPGSPCEDGIHDCDPGIYPGAPERCGNGIDEDLDGMIDEADACPAGDMDHDGQVPPRDCDDTDPLAYTHDPGDEVIDRCGDGVAQSCVPGGDIPCSEDRDMDGFVEPARCENNAMINPDRMEICNGIDDDCDGTTDEVLDPAASSGCIDRAAVLFATDFGHCGACRNLCDAVVADQCRAGVCDCTAEDPTGPPGACAGTNPACCGALGCHDLDSDPASCGGCGVRCGQGETCSGGICRCGSTAGAGAGAQACPEPAGVTGMDANVCCSGSCVDVRDDEAHCGGCGVGCGTTSALCDDRICRCDPAAPTMADCDGDLGRGGNGCETATDRSLAHCGRCGLGCNPAHATPMCSGSACSVASCDAGWDDCNGIVNDGCETNLRSVSDCGSCRTRCSISNATPTCASGSCRVTSCNSGWDDCNRDGTSCETQLNQMDHCGSCTNVCAVGQSCSPVGVCVCNSSSCGSGCCAGSSCVPYPSQTDGQCGTGGASCGACGAGRECGASGNCICNASSCPSGCCNGSSCVPYASQSSGQCGTGGAMCGGCSSGQTCSGSGMCVCNASSCPSGCCNGNTCVPYASQSMGVCGTGGASCTGCSSGQTCSGSGMCVCNPSSCPAGCCAGSTCVPYGSQTSSQCGSGGAACGICPMMQMCLSGTCAAM